jgi:hypothetical protein
MHITPWMEWFLGCLTRAIEGAQTDTFRWAICPKHVYKYRTQANVKHVRQMMNFTNQGKARNKTTRIAASQTNHFAVRVDAGEQTPSTQSTGAGR